MPASRSRGRLAFSQLNANNFYLSNTNAFKPPMLMHMPVELSLQITVNMNLTTTNANRLTATLHAIH